MAFKKVGTSDELTKVSEEIDEEEIRRFNPETPVADEDGIIRNAPLLAGYVDENGTLHDTFSYREMTGKDEEAISKADIRSNGAKLINTLVERCVVAIGTLTKKECGGIKWAKIIREMLGGDLDYMAFKIRELSKGNEVTFQHKCPNCGQKLITVVGTDEFEIKPFKGDFSVEFTLDRGYKNKANGAYIKNGTLDLPNGYVREIVTPIFKKNPATATTMLLTKCLHFDGAVISQQSVSEMTTKDRSILENIIKENTFGIDTAIDGIMCENCGQDLSGEIGESNFF